jgi:hypothetical protein
MLVNCGGGSSEPTPTPTPFSISISPANATSLVNQVTQFTATVKGTTNTGVTWSIQEKSGGVILDGAYQAPWATGTYHVVATSKADPTKSATATVAVSAQFAFVQKIPGGESVPYSVTPILGSFGADGAFATTNLIDSGTGKPLDTNIYSAFLSADGKKAVAEMPTPVGDAYTWNIHLANSDGTGVTQLTNNTTTDVFSTWPQFSPSGTKIIYLQTDRTAGTWGQIWVMNADGSDPHAVFGTRDTAAWNPAFSPDESKIIAEVAQWVGEEWYDGIAVMNADGTGVVQLTGEYNPACVDGWDEMPTFTNDGQLISFSKLCWPQDGGVTENLYIMKANGTGLTMLQGSEIGNVILCQPRAVADKLVFSANTDFPGTELFEIYSIMPDGSKLTRLTNNTVFDGLSVAWMSWGTAPEAKQRVEHRQILRQRRGIR